MQDRQVRGPGTFKILELWELYKNLLLGQKAQELAADTSSNGHTCSDGHTVSSGRGLDVIARTRQRIRPLDFSEFFSADVLVTFFRLVASTVGRAASCGTVVGKYTIGWRNPSFLGMWLIIVRRRRVNCPSAELFAGNIISHIITSISISMKP